MFEVFALLYADREAIAVRPASDTWRFDPPQTFLSIKADHTRDKVGAPKP